MSVEIISLVSSALATVVGGALASYAKRQGHLFTGIELIAAANSADLTPKRDPREEVRLPEVIQLLDDEERRRSLFRYSSASLVIGQFIVGGVLTSSFVTTAFSEHVVGFLGLLVLASSLVSQHFRPDLLHKSSAVKIHRLTSLRRWIEDELYEATRGEIDDARITKIRRRVSAELSEIEESDLQLLSDDKTNEA
ncbi:hypothetical protein [Actomonas aquatica]|uniref:SMODS and SLOG-associating 2TM effector domain-containing protein n=1 Tax=Actomonas aquatica TaxID=2866162 RepID=A0ABZ1C2E6_9BACT|nr:hypothetical protein [Opitutus sp. WL0086]WRQ85750.1 hypothetical protein K1X11_013140 [Opitutus sp. WL0086]